MTDPILIYAFRRAFRILIHSILLLLITFFLFSFLSSQATATAKLAASVTFVPRPEILNVLPVVTSTVQKQQKAIASVVLSSAHPVNFVLLLPTSVCSPPAVQPTAQHQCSTNLEDASAGPTRAIILKFARQPRTLVRSLHAAQPTDRPRF